MFIFLSLGIKRGWEFSILCWHNLSCISGLDISAWRRKANKIHKHVPVCCLCTCHETSVPGFLWDISSDVTICSYFDREPLAYIPPYKSYSKVFHRTSGLRVYLLQEKGTSFVYFFSTYFWWIFQSIYLKTLWKLNQIIGSVQNVLSVFPLVLRTSRQSINIFWINENALQFFIIKQR